MSRRKRMLLVLMGLILALVLGTSSWAQRGNQDDGEEMEFDDARIFLEYNSTDDDLGVQVFLDGEAWKSLRISDPREKRFINVTASGNLAKLGLTELFFESAEPSPDSVLGLIREGIYEFEGIAVSGAHLESEAELSHDLPPIPNILVPSVPGEELDPFDAVIAWDPIDDIESIEVIVENEDVGAEMLVPLPADATSLHIPEEFLEPDTEYKVEIIAIGENGNKTLAEREFVTGS